ncbi:hypothetical protein EYF80_050195 [Liparis tanakae]|uniref:Uncharacterized protein n=1 Tax=Liparis tanakae TaxID=230148 RepID=A0A4Z2FEK0_9TELE|nr:hypothetical protein EYF80_050195 [Liparis tanakae]
MIPGCSSLARAFTSRNTFSRASSLWDIKMSIRARVGCRLHNPSEEENPRQRGESEEVRVCPARGVPVGQTDPFDGVVAVVHFVAGFKHDTEPPAAEALHRLEVRQREDDGSQRSGGVSPSSPES